MSELPKRKREKAHIGQWLDVDGEPVHILASPDMSEKTANALRELVRVVRQAIDDGTLLPEADDEAEGDGYECEYCGGRGVDANGLSCEACEGTGWDW